MSSLRYLPLRLGAILAVLLAYKIPSLLRERDDRFYEPIHRTEEDLRRLGDACTGNTTIHLTPDTLFRLKDTMPSQTVPVGTVTLSYTTTRCESNNNDNDGNSTAEIEQGEGIQEGRIKSGKHFLLLHATGLNSLMFTETANDDWPTLWELLRNDGYDVTAVDLRGHGLSEITAGPYSVDLLAADIAAFVRKMFPDETVHCHGVSAGLGVCMALSLHDAPLIETLTGSGFLFDRTNGDFVAYLFSREILARFLGMDWIGTLVGMACKCSQPGIINRWIKHTRLDGYVELSKSWLRFDITWGLPTFSVPTLYLLPEYDEDLGHTKFLIEGELRRMPASTVREIVEFPGYSHVMISEENGAKKIAEAVIKFVDKVKSKEN